jgi:hypothetical protein
MAAPGRPGGRQIPVHRLRPNEKEWSPPSVIFFDTETSWEQTGPDEFHRLRLWCACHVDRRATMKKAPGVEWGWGTDQASLAAWVNQRMIGRECVWMYAHNLNFDLVTSNLAERMAGHGWELGDFAVSHGSPWLRLGKGRKTLTVVDSWAWLPQSLESLGTLMGTPKLPLPANEGGKCEWLGRCAKDVDILARCVLALMAWWDTEKLGRWTISGAGCGWNAMRHIHSPERHVIDVDPDLVAQDRQAVRGGRKDAAVVRSAGDGPWVELDLTAAYPTVAKDLPLPVKRGWTFDRLPIDSPFLRSPFHGVIARALVDTDRPWFPVRHDGVTWYPVGRFWTVLAGPELRWAADSGQLVEIAEGQGHRLGHALRPWATWVLDPSRGGEVPVPPVGLVAAKAWGRSVLGKFAARTHTSDPLEGVAPAGWGATDLWDGRVGRRGADVRMGGRRWLVTYNADTENCYPAVLAWVESEVRVRLGRVLEALDGAWWTADTDGLLVDMQVIEGWLRLGLIRLGDRPRDAFGLAGALCDWLAPMVAPLTIRPKRQVESLAVLGPQHLIVGDTRRMSGVSARATETAPGRFVGRDWPGLKWQMENSTPGVYRRPERVSTFTGPTVHRWVLDDGATRPAEFRVGADGSNQLVPWAETRWAAEGGRLAEVQYRLLQRVS